MRVVDPEEGTPYVLEALRQLRRALGERAAALGFAGAPFTLACYLIDGRPSREYPRTKAMMYGEPDLWDALMSRLAEVTARYLGGAGAGGRRCGATLRFVARPRGSGRCIASGWRRIPRSSSSACGALRRPSTSAPVRCSLLPEIAATRPSMVSVDWRLPIDRAWDAIGGDLGIQGNLDPTMLLAPWETVRAGASDVLARAGGRPGHIFNLGHGLLPETNPDQLARLVELVHGYRQDGQDDTVGPADS